MARRAIQPLDVYSPNGYALAWRVGGIVQTAGLLAFDASGRLVGPGDFEVQCVQVFENLRRVLTAANSALDDVVKLTIIVGDAGNLHVLREVRSRYFAAPGPAATLLEIRRDPPSPYLVEIEAMAIVED